MVFWTFVETNETGSNGDQQRGWTGFHAAITRMVKFREILYLTMLLWFWNSQAVTFDLDLLYTSDIRHTNLKLYYTYNLNSSIAENDPVRNFIYTRRQKKQ